MTQNQIPDAVEPPYPYDSPGSLDDLAQDGPTWDGAFAPPAPHPYVPPATPYAQPFVPPYVASPPNPYSPASAPPMSYQQPSVAPQPYQQAGLVPADKGFEPYFPPEPGASAPYPLVMPAYQRTVSNGLGTAALILGILSVTCVGMVAGIPAIILGVLGRKAADEGRANNRGTATAGLVLGAIGVAFTVLAVIMFVGFVAAVR